MVRQDNKTIEILFVTIQNIRIKGLVGEFSQEGVKKNWVTVEDIWRDMPRPQLNKPEIRDFCEFQVKLGNLEKREGKKTGVRQAEAEYKLSQQGETVLLAYGSVNFANIRNMFEWHRSMAKKKRESSDTKDASKSDADVDNKTEDP